MPATPPADLGFRYHTASPADACLWQPSPRLPSLARGRPRPAEKRDEKADAARLQRRQLFRPRSITFSVAAVVQGDGRGFDKAGLAGQRGLAPAELGNASWLQRGSRSSGVADGGGNAAGVGLPDRQYLKVLQSMGQSVHIFNLDGKIIV